MTALVHRESGSGPPLVLIHAFPLDGRMWQPQLDALAGDFRVIAPDFFGFGDSPMLREGWTMDSAAEALSALLDRLAILDKVFLGGLSMGGYIALAFARRYPKRLRGLILADTRAEADSEEAKSARSETIAFVEANSTAALIDKMLPKMLSPETHAHRKDVVALVRELAAVQCVPAVVAALRALRDRSDSTESLKSFNFPTLVIVGREDAITPPALAEAMVRELKQPRLVVIESAGHLSNLEVPEAFTNAVRNWASSFYEPEA